MKNEKSGNGVAYRRSRLGQVALGGVALVATLLTASSLFATGYLRLSSPTQIEIEVREGIPVPEGRTLVGVEYSVRKTGQVHFVRTLQYQRGYLGISTRNASGSSDAARSDL